MSSSVIAILWIIFTIGTWIAYHKIFSVYYFSISKGLMKEIITCAFVGILLTSLTLYFWWLTALIIIVVGIVISGKVDDSSKRKAIIIFFVILAIVIALSGIVAKSA